MRDQSWTNLVVVVAAVVVVVAVSLLAVVVPGVSIPTRGTGAASTPTVFENLSIVRGSSGDYEYNQTQLSVPVNTMVVFTITNYDPSISLLPTPNDAVVTGTQNGTMTVVSAAAQATVGSLPTNDVSHTFTMSDAYYHLNVPVPPALAAGVPTHITFSMIFHFVGTGFAWGCVAYCGGPLMIGMYGTITVR